MSVEDVENTHSKRGANRHISQFDDQSSTSCSLGAETNRGSSQMFLQSLFYERTVLSLLEKVERLPRHEQAEIATKVSNYINEAKKADDDAVLKRFVNAARSEYDTARAASESLRHLAAPALAEAWCTARLGLSKNSMDQHSAIAIIVAVEGFALKCATQAKM